MRLKQSVCNIIRDDGHRSLANRIFSHGITALIIFNVATVALDLLYMIPEGAELFFEIAEAVTVIIFTLEYALRLWTADLLHPKVRPAVARFRYMRSPMAIVDVLAVLPFYLPFAFPVNTTILRLLRLLRLARIMKLNRYSDAKTSEMVMSSIQEAFVLVDTDHNFLSANKSAENLFPSIKKIKKYESITQIENWPAELKNFDEKTLGRSVQFIMGGDNHYKANISMIFDKEKLLRYVILIQDITESVLLDRAEKERIEAELDMASKIQASLLPNRFPAFPGRDEFDIFALMNPAKEVGGDFYDFFFIDKNKLAVVIADVSGKGMPAALFMVNAKTQLKNIAIRQETSIAQVMETVNDLLCEGNDECLFVTIFFGVLDIPSGKFSYIDAGHDKPLVKTGEDNFNWLPTRPGLMAGFMEGSTYAQSEITLQKGDILFLYTDGVTEAENPAKEQFSTERLKIMVNGCDKDSPKEILSYIRKEIDAFADGEEQFDDIAMLALRVN
ncbi:MAG: SpoIIE family protein phosphatase [Defluviitaleaceae bacterium]|nr:SpoIIE family protein phosphatase [Defluviitaleaceae bacterium]MCL2264222.1 SpoIIE family protein phosphatase [Defluviitaleaceae bacterium]